MFPYPDPMDAEGRDEAYRPGVCNIGPAEIAQRRRLGHLGAVIALALAALIVLVDAPPVAALLLFVPAGGAAMGYLQAALRFCAGFGMRGVHNMGDDLRRTTPVAAAGERDADRRRSVLVLVAAALVGVAVAGLAYLTRL